MKMKMLKERNQRNKEDGKRPIGMMVLMSQKKKIEEKINNSVKTKTEKYETSRRKK